MGLKEIFERKRNAYAKWRDVMDAATKEDRALTSDDQKTIDECEAAIDQCNKEVEQIQRRDESAAKLAAVADEMRQTPPGQLQQELQQPVKADKRPLVERFRELSEQGYTRSEAIDKLAKQRDEEKSRAFRRFLLGSQAVLQKDDDSTGGYLVAPEQFIAQLIKDLDNQVWIRQFATVIPVVGAEGIGVPTLDTDFGSPEWTTELSVGSEDTSMVFGKRKLTPHPLARYIKVSKDLLRSAAISVDAEVRQRMAYKFGVIEETAFMTGSGAGEPLGLFTASDSGISTSQDESTDNAGTYFTADGLINAKYKLTSPWLQSANLRWVFHRTAVKMARQLKDGDANYMWRPGLTADRGDTLLDVPISISEYAPSSFLTTLYVGLIGDLSYYWIADNMSLEIQRLVELGALSNEDYFVGRLACDGMPILEKAFVRVKLG